MNFIKYSFLSLLIFITLNGYGRSHVTDQKDTTTAFFRQYVNQWEKAFNSKHLGDYLVLFNDTIDYNGKKIDKYSYITKKYLSIKKYPDLSVKIAGDIQIDKLNDYETRCSFKQILTINGNTTEFPSYLVFQQEGDDWKISEVCDSVVAKSSQHQNSAQTLNSPSSETGNKETASGVSSVPNPSAYSGQKDNESSSDYGIYIIGFLFLFWIIYKFVTGKADSPKSPPAVKRNPPVFSPAKKEPEKWEIKNSTFEQQNNKTSKMSQNFYCEYCGRKSSSIANLTGAICIRHPNGPNKGHCSPYQGSEKSEYTCINCGRKSSSIANLTGAICIRHPNGTNKGHCIPSL